MLGRLQLAFDQAVYPQDVTSMAWQSDIPCANFTDRGNGKLGSQTGGDVMLA
jgi:hypothetical protein